MYESAQAAVPRTRHTTSQNQDVSPRALETRRPKLGCQQVNLQELLCCLAGGYLPEVSAGMWVSATWWCGSMLQTARVQEGGWEKREGSRLARSVPATEYSVAYES